MGTLSISLSPDVERFVTKKVESAQYTTKDEVVNTLLQEHMRREWEQAWTKQKNAIRSELAKRGEFASVPTQ